VKLTFVFSGADSLGFVLIDCVSKSSVFFAFAKKIMNRFPSSYESSVVLCCGLVFFFFLLLRKKERKKHSNITNKESPQLSSWCAAMGSFFVLSLSLLLKRKQRTWKLEKSCFRIVCTRRSLFFKKRNSGINEHRMAQALFSLFSFLSFLLH